MEGCGEWRPWHGHFTFALGFASLPPNWPLVHASLSLWIGFNVLVLALLGADMMLFRRADRPAGTGRLVLTTLVWIAVAIAFGLWIGHRAGSGKSLEFFTGYLIEYALSLDNILLFVLIFSSFAIAPEQQRRVLFWGVMGALVMRGLMILAGVALIERFAWIFYVFGAYIIYAGASLVLPRTHRPVEEGRVVRLARRWLPLSTETNSTRFIVREAGRRRFTLLFLVLIVIELTDLVFALDSIPAIFGVTTDPFIVYTSNACAIMGLRSLYFLLARAVRSLVYLQPGLAAVLVFIGAKMLLKDVAPISTGTSLAVVGGILAVAVIASLLKGPKGKEAHAHT